jgi:hypothetical protein
MKKKERVGPKLLAHGFAVLLAFFALYMLFTGAGQAAELAAGGICGGLVALFDAAMRARNERPLDLNLAMLRPLVPALGQLVTDTVRVAIALIAAVRAPPSGEFNTIPAPAENGPGSPAGRGIATAAASLAPNEFVVGDGPEGGRLLVHQLVA